MSDIQDCGIIKLPKHSRRWGNETCLEDGSHLPFDISRIYYLYDMPGGTTRGAHAHRQLEQLLVSVMGAFDVVLDDGNEKRTFRLDRADQGLYIPRLIWREIENFSSGVVCLVLASLVYDTKDYIHDREEFLSLRGILPSDRS